MPEPFSRPEEDQSPSPLKILFVDVDEADAASLTKDVPIKVVRAEDSASNDAQVSVEGFDALVLDAARSGTDKIRKLKKTHRAAVLLLTDTCELPKAIEFIRGGADGFLLRGISTPRSFVQLALYANRIRQN